MKSNDAASTSMITNPLTNIGSSNSSNIKNGTTCSRNRTRRSGWWVPFGLALLSLCCYLDLSLTRNISLKSSSSSLIGSDSEPGVAVHGNIGNTVGKSRGNSRGSGKVNLELSRRNTNERVLLKEQVQSMAEIVPPETQTEQAQPAAATTTAPATTTTEQENYSHLQNGAFIHLGKTGGSTLAQFLANACHSFVKKPCPHKDPLLTNNAVSRKVSTYYHVPDFGSMAQRPLHPFTIVTLRDPYDRTRSGFVYGHPRNAKAVGSKNRRWHNLRYEQYNKSMANMTQCFPNLETFVQHLAVGYDGDGHEAAITDVHNDTSRDSSYPSTRLDQYGRPIYELHQEDCPRFAWAALHHQVAPFVHLYYNLGQIHQLLVPPGGSSGRHLNDTVLFVIRQEQLTEDWTTVHAMLSGQPPPPSGTVDTTPPLPVPTTHTKARDVSQLVLPVPNDLSEPGRQILCHALREEYQEYHRFLRAAVNLSPKDVAASLALSQQNCPEVKFWP